MLIDGERRLHQFYIYLKNSERMIELAQLYNGLNESTQGILGAMIKVNSSKNLKEYALLVNSMMVLKDKLDSSMAESGLMKGDEEVPPSEGDRNDIITKQAMIILEEAV